MKLANGILVPPPRKPFFLHVEIRWILQLQQLVDFSLNAFQPGALILICFNSTDSILKLLSMSAATLCPQGSCSPSTRPSPVAPRRASELVCSRIANARVLLLPVQSDTRRPFSGCSQKDLLRRQRMSNYVLPYSPMYSFTWSCRPAPPGRDRDQAWSSPVLWTLANLGRMIHRMALREWRVDDEKDAADYLLRCVLAQ